MTKKTYLWVDGLKGIAIIGIVVIHSGAVSLPGIIGKIGNQGQFGVQLFFLLSGFLTYDSLTRFFYDEWSSSRAIKWIITRFIRLIPLYYFAILVSSITFGPSDFFLGSEGKMTLANYLAHLTFTHGLVPHFMNCLFGEWYIGVLAIYYIIAPFLYRILQNNFRRVTVLFIFAELCGVAICEYARQLLSECNDYYIYVEYFAQKSFLSQFPVIILGIVLFFYTKTIHINATNNNRQNFCFSWILVFVAVLGIIGMIKQRNSLFLVNESTLYGIIFLILSISQTIYLSKLLNNKFFCYLGKYSYPIYLFHIFFIWIYNKYIHIYVLNDIASWMIKFISVIIMSALLAWPLQRLSDTIIHFMLKPYSKQAK